MPKKLTLIAFNEANFDLIEKYSSRYPLSSLRKIMTFQKYSTQANENYDSLEPWVQWVTVYTGKGRKEHGVHRLGNSTQNNQTQIFENLEKRGADVFALGPMNATNKLERTRSRFIPDPWTNTPPDSSLWSRVVHRLLRQTVNDNSIGKISIPSALTICLLFALKSTWKGRFFLVSIAIKSIKKRWYRALFLDYLLAEFFCKSARNRDQFNFVFLNGMAHIQHHYFFNSAYYDGPMSNPEWYVSSVDDPILDALHVYDRIFQLILAKTSPNDSLLVATGISQEPYDVTKFYYRLINHTEFLTKLGIKYDQVWPGMTRDFTVTFSDRSELEHGLAVLKESELNGVKLFTDVEETEHSVFCTLGYPYEVSEEDRLECASGPLRCRNYFAFVAVKNAKHRKEGYIYTNKSLNSCGCRDNLDLRCVHDLILELWESTAEPGSHLEY